jgi:hypothetical protein
MCGVVNPRRIDGKDGVAGSIPAGGSTPNEQARPGSAPGSSHGEGRWPPFARNLPARFVCFESVGPPAAATVRSASRDTGAELARRGSGVRPVHPRSRPGKCDPGRASVEQPRWPAGQVGVKAVAAAAAGSATACSAELPTATHISRQRPRTTPSTTPPTQLAQQVGRLQVRALASGLAASSTAGRRPGWAGIRLAARIGSAVSEPWIHIGRVWTNGEPLLAMDSGLVDAWDSDERFDELVDLRSEATRIPIGGGFAGIIGDGTVNDERWIEVSNRGGTASPSSTSAASPVITRSRMHWPTQLTQMHTAAPSRFPAVNWRCSAPRSTKSGTTACRWFGRRPGRRPGPTGRPPCPRPVPRWSQDCW